MKRFLILFALGLLLLTGKNATAQDGSKSSGQNFQYVDTSISFTFDQKTYRYGISDDDLRTAPRWDPSAGDPPLSVTAALNTAREALPRLMGAERKWILRNIQLDRIGTDGWVYELSFSCSSAVCSEHSYESFIVIVKMDGSIIEPTVTDDKLTSIAGRPLQQGVNELTNFHPRRWRTNVFPHV